MKKKRYFVEQIVGYRGRYLLCPISASFWFRGAHTYRPLTRPELGAE